MYNVVMTKEYPEDIKKAILAENKMLYCMKSRPCNETCMCWGLEIENGWLSQVDEMSKHLEALNYIFYPKFKVRVQMDQVKSKFCTLRAYYSVVVDPPKWMCIWKSSFMRVFDWIAKLDFKKVEVLDRDAYDEVVEKELASRKEFEEEKKMAKTCSNVEVFERDGKFIRKATYHKYKTTHYEPTKHKLLYKLLLKRHLVENWLMYAFDFKPSHEQDCIAALVDEKAKSIVEKAEKACYNVCEHCGRNIYDEGDYSLRCTTRGWIAYLCQECADKTESEYVMDGAVWKSGKQIYTKEEYAEEKRKIEERFKKSQEEDTDESEI